MGGVNDSPLYPFTEALLRLIRWEEGGGAREGRVLAWFNDCTYLKRIYRRIYGRSLTYVNIIRGERQAEGGRDDGKSKVISWTTPHVRSHMWPNRKFLKMVNFHIFVWLLSRGRCGPAYSKVVKVVRRDPVANANSDKSQWLPSKPDHKYSSYPLHLWDWSEYIYVT